MNHVSVKICTAVALVLATLAAYAEEGGTTTTTVTESGTSGGVTYRRSRTITRSSSSSRSRSSSGAGKKSSNARKKKARFKAGEEVLVERAGKLHEGKVVSIEQWSGWVFVKYKDDHGVAETHKFPPDNPIPAVRKGKKLLTSEPGLKGEFGKGDEVLFAFGGAHVGEVVAIDDRGNLEVRFDRNGEQATWTFAPHDLRLIESGEVPLVEAAAMRTWSSQGGKFTIEAKFVELRGDSVTLEKAGGKTLTVALDKLSDDDQELAHRLAEGAEGDPLASGAEKD
ncbi:MAG TPA: SHD1 domain-containing protein [Pirellulales bacterium]|nr:SHD1 domain-containing protein [Pirellulales bacterium]